MPKGFSIEEHEKRMREILREAATPMIDRKDLLGRLLGPQKPPPLKPPISPLKEAKPPKV